VIFVVVLKYCYQSEGSLMETVLFLEIRQTVAQSCSNKSGLAADGAEETYFKPRSNGLAASSSSLLTQLNP